MVIKINSKPIVVEDQDAASTAFDPVYLGVSCLGYFTILCLMDYVCDIFFSVHPLPFIHWIGGVSYWLLTLL